MHSRRLFLKHSAVAMLGMGAAPGWLSRVLYAKEAPGARKKVLIAIFQRGAVDGLNVVVPFGEKRYYDLRPTIAVPAPSRRNEDAAIDLDGFFGLHPNLAALKPLWDRRMLAIVEGAGSPDPTRSHFDAQDYMESGTPGIKSTQTGWLNRSLLHELHPSPLRAVSLTPDLPVTLRGPNGAVAVESIRNFRISDPSAAKLFENLYESAPDSMLNATGRETFEAVKLMQAVGKRPYEPANGAIYPAGKLGQNLRQIARLIKADVGLEVAFTDIGGWDTHVHEMGPRASVGRLPNLLRQFGDALAAFSQDMGDRMEDVVLVTMSEFGRTAKENGNRGTDHGHANVMFIFGGAVRGGKVYGKWPGMQPEQLYQGRDLALTTDFRTVLSELVRNHLGDARMASVFPNFAGHRMSEPLLA
ncbi:MAG TPA: DUF1501 domain-containing protein [Bryobacteraceae bacterium]|nr:DUF1501 domain-containing protein [Bryobacteraceae bacterium]